MVWCYDGMHLVKVPHRHQCFFSGPNKCSDLCSNLSTWPFSYLGRPRAQKRLKRAQIGIFMSKVICNHLFNVMGWNKAGTAPRTFRLTSLAHLPDQECPRYGPKWPNMLKIVFWQQQLGLLGLFWVGQGGTRVGGTIHNFYWHGWLYIPYDQ